MAEIACYRSIKLTARNVRMALDLGDSDQMVEIALDGGSEIDEGIYRILKRFGVCLTTTMEKDFIHDVTEETNR